MALISQLSASIGGVGDALKAVDGLFQKQISIRAADNTGNAVFLSTTESEDFDFAVDISEHPIADSGGAVDYVSGTTTPYALNGILSNRNLDMRQNPLGAITSRASAFAPAAFAAIGAGVSAASKFFDLGDDQITVAARQLIKWCNDATPVIVSDSRIDIRKIVDQDQVYLIKNSKFLTSEDLGDCVGVSIQLVNFFVLGSASQGTQTGSKIFSALVGLIKSPFG